MEKLFVCMSSRDQQQLGKLAIGPSPHMLEPRKAGISSELELNRSPGMRGIASSSSGAHAAFASVVAPQQERSWYHLGIVRMENSSIPSRAVKGKNHQQGRAVGISLHQGTCQRPRDCCALGFVRRISSFIGEPTRFSLAAPATLL